MFIITYLKYFLVFAIYMCIDQRTVLADLLKKEKPIIITNHKNKKISKIIFIVEFTRLIIELQIYVVCNTKRNLVVCLDKLQCYVLLWNR
jgi:hypothetical protein